MLVLYSNVQVLRLGLKLLFIGGTKLNAQLTQILCKFLCPLEKVISDYQIFNIHGGFSFESLVKTTMLCYVGIAFYPVEVSQ